MTLSTTITYQNPHGALKKIKASGVRVAFTIPRDKAIKLADQYISAVGIDAVRNQQYLREVTFSRAAHLGDNDLLQVLKMAMEHSSGKLSELHFMFDIPGSVMVLGIEGGVAVVITAGAPTIH